ncbi:molybdenum cofactor biosynthesis protein MoaE [Corynebacterium canis]|uniref:Molybdenum cofactor biosynthesis protein MoaE n=2 Tax=Corynebacterium canis TaxID=679663 RepID=A0A5C5UTS5_9CORY|nr:molybdenum cofactor biosynthesis protein MoaE [Corynebacterium canis]
MTYGRITNCPLTIAEIATRVADDTSGAIAVFDGRVRNHDHGREVTSLEYSAHPAAERIVQEVAEDIRERFGLCGVAIVHRVGHLNIGETALAAAVSSPHREAAFAALAELVDEVKKQVPVWKKQYYSDGTYEWSNCA